MTTIPARRLLLAALGASALLLARDGFGQDAKPASNWPREIDTPQGTLTVYQPQIDGYADGILDAHAAVAVAADGAAEPEFGAVWFRARLSTDRDARTCTIHDVQVPAARFRDATPEQETAYADDIRQAAAGWVHPLSMDHLLPALAAVEKRRGSDARLRNEPPRIIVRTTPSLLVPIDGDARLARIDGSSVERVVNTPVALLYEPESGTYWIDGGAAWLTSSSVDGPYLAADAAPPSIAAVETSNSADARPSTHGGAPAVVVSHAPTELIAFDGDPVWENAAPDLLYATNTSSAVLYVQSEAMFYVLLSGRWFRSASIVEGPWKFVAPTDLPQPFREIPEDSPMGGVLASVAGTPLADEALLDAQIPQTVYVHPSDARCAVDYDGDPDFEPVADTGIEYCVNTRSQVLLCKQRYYCCDQGVWFASYAPRGPWVVAATTPREFDEIPPEYPCFNVKFVHVFDWTPDLVLVGYTSGYLGCYAWGGAVVWGTGWQYSGWSGDAWYPRCSTWGVSASYSPWTGTWYEGLSFRWRGGWSVGVAGRKATGYGGSWWGPAGFRRWHRDDAELQRPVVQRPDFNRGAQHEGRAPKANLYAFSRNKGRNAPERSIPSTPQRPERRQPTPPERGRAPAENPRPATRPAAPREDVYADRDGRVFRRNTDGSWQERVDKSWRPATSNAPPQRAPSREKNPPERPTRPATPTPRDQPPTRETPPREPPQREPPQREPPAREPPTPQPREPARTPPVVERTPPQHPAPAPAPTPSLGRDAHSRDRAKERQKDGH